MKQLFLILLTATILQSCVLSTDYFQAKTDNGFFLTVRDRTGNEISTGASINDPEYIPELTEMYTELVAALAEIIKQQKESLEANIP